MRHPFSDYRNTVFVETGTFRGDGVAKALQSGFSNVISFEVKKDLYDQCVRRFANDDRVTIVHGSSASILLDHIKNITVPITFWLDGHYSCGITGYDTQNICPLLKELDQIKHHSIKTHTILIDDRRLMVDSTNDGMDGKFGLSESEVVAKLKSINPDYRISYRDGYIKDDIIVAQV